MNKQKLFAILTLIILMSSVIPYEIVRADDPIIISCNGDPDCVQVDGQHIKEEKEITLNCADNLQLYFRVLEDNTEIYWRVTLSVSLTNTVDIPSYPVVLFQIITGAIGAYDQTVSLPAYGGQTVTWQGVGNFIAGTNNGYSYNAALTVDQYYCRVTGTSQWKFEVQATPFDDSCAERYVVTDLETYHIDPLIETPMGGAGSPPDEQRVVTLTGQLYMIKTAGGPWNDGTDDRWDTAASWDGETWFPFEDLIAIAECIEQDPVHPELLTVYVEAQSPNFYIRVDDTAGNFGDNTEVEELTYTIGVVASTVTCESQFSYDPVYDVVASVYVHSENSNSPLTNPAATNDLVIGEWYAVVVMNGTTWTDNGGPPRVDMEFATSILGGVHASQYYDLAEGSPLVWCQTDDGLITFIQADQGSLYLRANDQDTVWTNNEGILDVSIYHTSFNRTEEPCELQFALDDLVRSDSVDAKQENGKTFAFAVGTAVTNTTDNGAFWDVGLVPGGWYALETTGGPWGYPGSTTIGAPQNYDLAVGESNEPIDTPSTWGELAEWPRADCNVQTDSFGHRLIYFQMPVVGAFSFFLRVNDTAVWDKNTGSMSWNLYRAIDMHVPESELCDYSFDAGDQIGATQTVDAKASDGAYIMGLSPNTYYAIEILGSTYQWQEVEGGDDLTDMQLSVNAGQIWNDIPGSGSLCAVMDGSNQIVYVHTPEAGTPQFKLRVASDSFSNNTGEMGWNVYTATAGPSINPWDGCVTEGYNVTQIGPWEWIPVIDANGRGITSSTSGSSEIGGLVPGNKYIVETSHGPWYPSEDQSVGNSKYSAEVSSDGGQTWHALDGTNPDVSCWETSQDLKYRKIEFTVQQGQSWKIRVADTGDFTDNTGNLAYTLKGLVLPSDPLVDGIINIPGCDVPPLVPAPLSVSELSDLGNYLAGWFDFLSASVISFFAWCPEHTNYVIGWGNNIEQREPFATIDEFESILNDVQNEINGYNWSTSEDYSLLDKSPSASYAMMQQYIFGEIPDDSPWKGGPLVDFNTPGFEFSENCDLALSDYVGPALGKGVCFTANWAKETGMMFWVQLSLDVSIFFACVISVLSNFRKTIYLFTGVNLDSRSGDSKVFVEWLGGLGGGGDETGKAMNGLSDELRELNKNLNSRDWEDVGRFIRGRK